MVSLPTLDSALNVGKKTRLRRPYQVGVHRDIPLPYKGNIVDSIHWIAVSDGFLGTIEIFSPSAKSLRVAMSGVFPEEAEITIFEIDERGVSKSYATLFSGEDLPLSDKSYWLPSVSGSRMGIHIWVSNTEGVTLRINQVSHRYQRLLNQAEFELDGCQNHRNSVCARSEFHTKSAATGLISFEKEDGSYICSGTLMNDNTRDSFIPYFLTAEHCINDQVEADTVEVKWYYRTRDCNTKELDDDFSSGWGGAYLLKSDRARDMSLLKFKRQASAGDWYAGWDLSEYSFSRGDEVISFHHPLGQEQKYAEGRIDGIVDVDACDDDEDNCRVLRDAISVPWERGATEPGSSGGGLFNDGYLIGVLSGSSGECEDSESYFGNLSDAWATIGPFLTGENNDDHGDDEDTATYIDEISLTDGTIETPYDDDMFRLRIKYPGNILIYTIGGMDTVGLLYNDDVEYEDDDSGLIGRNFEIKQDLDPGAYFLRVRDYGSSTGSYSLLSSFTLGDIPNEWQNSYRIEQFPFDLSAAVEDGDDIDWYLTRVRVNGTLKLRTQGSTDTTCSIRPSTGTGLKSRRDDDSGVDQNCRVQMSVVPGYYYFTVKGHDESVTGRYRIEVDFEVEDDHADDFEGATDIALHGDNRWYYEVSYLDKSDEDYFKIETKGDGYVTASSTGTLDLMAELFNEDKERVVFNDDSGVNKNFQIYEYLSAGIYFLKVEGYFDDTHGYYILDISLSE